MKATTLILPLVLPGTLTIAEFALPYPMTEQDYQALCDALMSWRPALVEEPEAGTVKGGDV